MPYVITARHAEGSAPPADIIAAGADPARVYCAACIDAYRNGIEPGEPACDEAITVAVATLEGARAAVLAALELGQPNRPNHAGAHATVCAIQELPEAGGTIGPLPDGTIIEVRPVDLAEMRADMIDADPDWTGPDAILPAAWCDLYEVDAADATPGMPGNDEPDERHQYDA